MWQQTLNQYNANNLMSSSGLIIRPVSKNTQFGIAYCNYVPILVLSRNTAAVSSGSIGLLLVQNIRNSFIL